MKIEAPHIPLGISLEEALAILHRISSNIEKRTEEDNDFYKLVSDEFECGFYEQTGKVVSSWYNDPLGRNSEEGINEKVSLYLSRYGNLEDWKNGINNGWMQFFNNENSKVALVYGIHKDVLRFNYLG